MTERDDVVARLRAAGCVFAEDEAALLDEAAAGPDHLAALVARRVDGVPLEQVLGWVAFAGLRLAVAPGAFVPRRRTELLVRSALEGLASGGTLVDLCCGVGAVAAAVVAATPDAVVHAVDVDPVAVDRARHNAPGAAVHVGDLDAPLPDALRGRVDVITACAPYVPTDAVALMPPEAREHEPRRALDGGADGLDVVRRIAALAPSWLAPGGRVVLEVGATQVEAASAGLEAAGLEAAVVTDEELGAVAVVGRPRAA